MIRLLTILFCLLWLTLLASNATAQECPPDMVCISREAAQKALEAGDKAKALEAELKANQEAYTKLKDTLNEMRVEFARTSGELTAIKQQAVRDAAIIEMLLQQTKKKRNAFITIF